MIDIHSHILQNVDDGSQSLKSSINMLKTEIENGVSSVILTPHYKTDSYMPSTSRILENFQILKDEVEKQNININLYLGQEIYCDWHVYDRLKNKEVLTINNTNYILIEFDFDEATDIADFVFNLNKLGYVPIIAHIERYKYLDWNLLFELRQMGALIQTNASCIVGKDGKTLRKSIIRAIKDGLIDFVGSDCHENRNMLLGKAYNEVVKTCGEETANNLFKLNAKKHFSL